MLGWISTFMLLLNFSKLILKSLKHLDSSVLSKMEQTKLEELSNGLARIQNLAGTGFSGYVLLSKDTNSGMYRIDWREELPSEEPAIAVTTVFYIPANNAPTLAEKLLQNYGRDSELGEWFQLNNMRLREIKMIAEFIDSANRIAPPDISITPSLVMEQLKQLKNPLSESVAVLKKMPMPRGK